MASSVINPPANKVELNPVSSTAQPSQSFVKQEPRELPIPNVPNSPLPTIPMTTTAAASSPQNRRSPPLPQHQPIFFDSISQLRDLSAAIFAFQRCYDDLHQHLDYIRTAIDSQMLRHLQNLQSVSDASPSTVPPSSNPLSVASEPEIPPEKSLVSEPTNPVTLQPKNSVPTTTTTTNDQPKTFHSELEQLCVTMNGRGLRRYIISRLSEASKLRQEVPLALKCSPEPAKLLLECIGKFYLQGSRAYVKNSHMNPGRRASILALECFLLMGMDGVAIDASLKAEADIGAVAWRKRLINEGGLERASEIDARGLLFFIACFGIPNVFKNEDIRALIQVSNAVQYSGALRQSPVFSARIPGIVEGMVNNRYEVEAVNIILTFGIEDKFSPQTILTSFLRRSKDAWTSTRKSSPSVMNEGDKRHLADMKSVIKCLEKRMIDPTKFLPGWQLQQKISSLEKDISAFGERPPAYKRKADEAEPLMKAKTKEAKLPGHGPLQKAAVNLDTRNHYGLPTQPTYLDGGFHSHISNYSASPSLMHTSGAGSYPENIAGQGGGSGMGLIDTGIGAGYSAGTSNVLPSSLYSGIHSRMPLDTVGYMARNSSDPYGWRGDTMSNERLVGPSYAGHHVGSGVNGLYRTLQFEGYSELPTSSSVGVSNQRSTSDLYQFADSVL